MSIICEHTHKIILPYLWIKIIAKKDEIFKKVKDMEQKSIKINVPEGYEIDRKNSTFEEIKFKPIKLNYSNVLNKLFTNNLVYWLNNTGDVCYSTAHEEDEWKNYPMNCSSSKQAKKILAINKLMNTAKYLNNGWVPDWDNYLESKWEINIVEGVISCMEVCSIIDMSVLFRTKELAEKAVEILGEDTIRLALSTDY